MKKAQVKKPQLDMAEALKFATEGSNADQAGSGIAEGTKTDPRRIVTAKQQVSGLVPSGDVRLTANIRQDLHLKLKIAAAERRTTIGEIIEDLIQSHL